MQPFGRLRIAALAFAAVVAVGVAGYSALGFGPLDALYQTITTITTVGFREVEPFDRIGKAFTIGLILAGVGTALYTFGVVFESLAEGELLRKRRRRRMDRRIAGLRDHVIVCGWGRVGQAIGKEITAGGGTVVVVDISEARLADVGHLCLVGDATDDDVLIEAGVEQARALIAAINTDAENLYVTLSGRSLRADLFIVARVRDEASEAKLLRGGADRVVNPQAIGGARMAAFVSQPHVSEFLDVVMQDSGFEFRLEEVVVAPTSPFAGSTLRSADIRERTGALVLAIRHDDTFFPKPDPDTIVGVGDVLIAIGTAGELGELVTLNRG